jgi:hypothetical protein
MNSYATRKKSEHPPKKSQTAKNFPPKSEALRKKSQMPKTSRQNPGTKEKISNTKNFPPNPRHGGKNLKCQRLPAKIRGIKEKTSNAKNFPPKSKAPRKKSQNIFIEVS